eukprot:Cvel_17410.t1-p1 / transcript=Cvel_17410.t1 / gene=Cvel_17410 / organism=Chromera_velia_CCMP2878 / gene_product=hypothetical protein / transcript_product=hypothetical protein / location=Cvel_scaffold1386:45082-48445(+) / protein_length=844 / sequence_SO=supercontig / SO=protein_coding / is_pseudo=false
MGPHQGIGMEGGGRMGGGGPGNQPLLLHGGDDVNFPALAAGAAGRHLHAGENETAEGVGGRGGTPLNANGPAGAGGPGGIAGAPEPLLGGPRFPGGHGMVTPTGILGSPGGMAAVNPLVTAGQGGQVDPTQILRTLINNHTNHATGQVDQAAFIAQGQQIFGDNFEKMVRALPQTDLTSQQQQASPAGPGTHGRSPGTPSQPILPPPQYDPTALQAAANAAQQQQQIQGSPPRPGAPSPHMQVQGVGVNPAAAALNPQAVQELNKLFILAQQNPSVLQHPELARVLSHPQILHILAMQQQQQQVQQQQQLQEYQRLHQQQLQTQQQQQQQPNSVGAPGGGGGGPGPAPPDSRTAGKVPMTPPTPSAQPPTFVPQQQPPMAGGGRGGPRLDGPPPMPMSRQGGPQTKMKGPPPQSDNAGPTGLVRLQQDMEPVSKDGDWATQQERQQGGLPENMKHPPPDDSARVHGPGADQQLRSPALGGPGGPPVAVSPGGVPGGDNIPVAPAGGGPFVDHNAAAMGAGGLSGSPGINMHQPQPKRGGGGPPGGRTPAPPPYDAAGAPQQPGPPNQQQRLPPGGGAPGQPPPSGPPSRVPPEEEEGMGGDHPSVLLQHGGRGGGQFGGRDDLDAGTGLRQPHILGTNAHPSHFIPGPAHMPHAQQHALHGALHAQAPILGVHGQHSAAPLITSQASIGAITETGSNIGLSKRERKPLAIRDPKTQKIVAGGSHADDSISRASSLVPDRPGTGGGGTADASTSAAASQGTGAGAAGAGDQQQQQEDNTQGGDSAAAAGGPSGDMDEGGDGTTGTNWGDSGGDLQQQQENPNHHQNPAAAAAERSQQPDSGDLSK